MEHLNVCPEEMVCCEAQKIGCSVFLKRFDIGKHFGECIFVRLLPVFDEQQRKIDLLMSEVNELKQKMSLKEDNIGTNVTTNVTMNGTNVTTNTNRRAMNWILPHNKKFIKLDEFTCGNDVWYVILDESKKDNNFWCCYVHMKNRRSGVAVTCDVSLGEVTKSFTFTFGEKWNRGWATFISKVEFASLPCKELRLNMSYI